MDCRPKIRESSASTGSCNGQTVPQQHKQHKQQRASNDASSVEADGEIVCMSACARVFA